MVSYSTTLIFPCQRGPGSLVIELADSEGVQHRERIPAIASDRPRLVQERKSCEHLVTQILVSTVLAKQFL